MAFDEYKQFTTLHTHLNSQKKEIRQRVVEVVSRVIALASQSIKYIEENRQNVTDKADYLNARLGGSQVEELKEIAKIQGELDTLYDKTIMGKQFIGAADTKDGKYKKKCDALEEENDRLKQAVVSLKLEIEQNRKFGVSSKFFYDSAVSKAKNQIEKLDCKRFLKLTINKFQDEFDLMKQSKDIQGVVSILHEILIAVRGFHTMKDKTGGKKIVVHQFSDGCQADLSMFLSMYNSELIDYFHQHGDLPSADVEYKRILGVRAKDAESLIKRQHQRLAKGGRY